MSKPVVSTANQNRGPWCAVCGAEKGSTNHWFVIITERLAIAVTEMEYPLVTDGEPVCGQACAVHKVSEWMSAKKS